MPVGSTIKTRWEDQAKAIYILDPDTGEPMGGSVTGTALLVSLKQWHYLGQEVIVANGEQVATLPAGTTAFAIEARGGAVHYNINGNTCTANNSYCPEDSMRTVGPMDNLVRLCVYGSDATTYAHMQYWRET